MCNAFLKLGKSCFLLIFLTLCLVPHANAEIPEDSSTAEVGFIFHKLANSQPDFDNWAGIYGEHDQKGYGPEGQRRQFKLTKDRLIRHYDKFDVEDKYITVNMPAKLEVIPVQQGLVAREYLLNIHFAGGKAPFISKQIPDYNVAIVIQNFDNMIKPIIESDEFKDLQGRTPFNIEKINRIYLSIDLEPIRVDSSGPINVKGKEYWLLLTKIGRLTVWDKAGIRMFWERGRIQKKNRELDELRSLYKSNNDTESSKEDLENIDGLF